MQLKDSFEEWAGYTDGKFTDRQWLLAKWESCEGVSWSDEKVDALMANIASRLQVLPGMSLADLGCGGAWILGALAGQAKFSLGLDFSLKMMAGARRASPASAFVQGEIGRLSLKASSFDRVLCYFVLINMMDDEMVERSLMDMYRVLKPGGRLLVGQLPDRLGSLDYDKAKAAYLEYCRQTFDTGKDLGGVQRMPQKLFDIGGLRSFLDGKEMAYEFLPSFNPFYRKGEPLTISWRFDLLLKKP